MELEQKGKKVFSLAEYSTIPFNVLNTSLFVPTLVSTSWESRPARSLIPKEYVLASANIGRLLQILTDIDSGRYTTNIHKHSYSIRKGNTDCTQFLCSEKDILDFLRGIFNLYNPLLKEKDQTVAVIRNINRTFVIEKKSRFLILFNEDVQNFMRSKMQIRNSLGTFEVSGLEIKYVCNNNINILGIRSDKIIENPSYIPPLAREIKDMANREFESNGKSKILVNTLLAKYYPIKTGKKGSNSTGTIMKLLRDNIYEINRELLSLSSSSLFRGAC